MHYSRRPSVTCHKECSAQPLIYYLLTFSMSGLHKDRHWTSNNPTGKSNMCLDPRRMDIENIVYRMRYVVHEKGDPIERGLCPRRGSAFI
ncbi:hypothetical protein AVEN_152729-1 [Araneus ventricosus]|uniref:Uncharacterized protein n=1 Tax=Araneus ventricosus TaxID=182803 RepID=A0A4Y2KJ18_ARAVE|nr:hypothetical protein AVEN_152729-1 [Araneus ventricosus]